MYINDMQSKLIYINSDEQDGEGEDEDDISPKQSIKTLRKSYKSSQKYNTRNSRYWNNRIVG